MSLNKKLIAATVTVGVVAAFFFLSQNENESKNIAQKKVVKTKVSQSDNHKDHADHDHSDHDHSDHQTSDNKKNPVETHVHEMGKVVSLKPLAQRDSFEPQNDAEVSVQVISSEIHDIFTNKKDPESFVDFLKSKSLRPRIAEDDNPYTGKMVTIRSEKALEGTRYYHAQYFEGSSGEMELQHISFEFRPSDNAFERAQTLLESQYDVEQKRYSVDGNFVEYDLPDSYTLWLKKLAKSDLSKPHPHNAYDPQKDVGTIVGAIERKIHE